MRNERGITLVELLAVLAIVGIITTLVTSVFINGKKASDRTVTNQTLQQEANYILETIRNEYLVLDDATIKLETSPNNLEMNDIVISEGYHYELIEEKINANEVITIIVNEIIIDRNESTPIKLKLTKDNLSYTIDTTLSKLR